MKKYLFSNKNAELRVVKNRTVADGIDGHFDNLGGSYHHLPLHFLKLSVVLVYIIAN